MKSIAFVQPRHSYAAPTGKGHVYTNTSLWIAAAKLIPQLEEKGMKISFGDENLDRFDTSDTDVIAVNAVGSPYIPEIRNRFVETLQPDQKLLVGGQVINGLSEDQFEAIFGKQSVQGFFYNIAQALDLDFSKIKADEQTSLIPVYEQISDDYMKEYLATEISFYVAQGCALACPFCSADKKRKEAYRDSQIIEDDLVYLVERAKKLGIDHLEMYVTNLDVFQTPDSLLEFSKILKSIQERYNFRIKWRGLATTKYFAQVAQKNPKILQAACEAGLHTIGFGVDGGDETVWARHKPTNTEERLVDSMEGCNEYGITPEAIMVFGHMEETRESLENALRLTCELQEKYGALPRPHVAKNPIPGDDYWSLNWKGATAIEQETMRQRIAYLVNNPQYFQAMDFKALASSISHPDPILRYMTNEYYRRITIMSGNFDELIYAQDPELSDEMNELNRSWNYGRYDR